jgi:hypothetical protein
MRKNNAFNKQHPELKGGEEFLTNASLDDHPRATIEYLASHGWIRFGEIAHNIKGEVIEKYRPVFKKQND